MYILRVCAFINYLMHQAAEKDANNQSQHRKRTLGPVTGDLGMIVRYLPQALIDFFGLSFCFFW